MVLMMWYDGLIGGFNEAIYGNAIRVLGGNIQIHAAGYAAAVYQLPLLPLANDQALAQAAQAQPQVMAATRRINTGGMATTREGTFGVTIVGVEPEKEVPVSLRAQKVSAGRYLRPTIGTWSTSGRAWPRYGRNRRRPLYPGRTRHASTDAQPHDDGSRHL